MSGKNDEKVLRVFYEGDVESEGRISHEAPFYADAAWAAESTSLTEDEVKAAIATLEHLGYIKTDLVHPGKYHINHDKIEDIERMLGKE